MSDLLDGLLADLADEGDALRAVVAGLDPADADAGWAAPTPAPGWTVAHQVAHLVWTDAVALLAATAARDGGPGGWQGGWQEVADLAAADPDGFVDAAADDLAGLAGPDLLARWDAGRAALAAALRDHPEGERMPWFGPPMAATSMATARFMETWAHGQDVRDGLGVVAEPTDRVRHVAHLAVRTRDFAFGTRGEQPPAEPFRVELVAPSGDRWTWGPEDAAQRVTGPALDLCLLATQRVHRADTALTATGTDADRWLDVAQCFAGPPGPGRPPRG